MEENVGDGNAIWRSLAGLKEAGRPQYVSFLRCYGTVLLKSDQKLPM
jgi:hypothetical protein